MFLYFGSYIAFKISVSQSFWFILVRSIMGNGRHHSIVMKNDIARVERIEEFQFNTMKLKLDWESCFFRERIRIRIGTDLRN